MKVLGVDPGSSVTGYGIIEKRGDVLFHLGNGEIAVKPKTPFPQSLKMIHHQLEKVILDYSPDVMAIENLFFHRNAKTALRLGHVRGILILTAVNIGLDIYEYSPLEIKQAVVGYGRATKDQIQIMVKDLLTLPEVAPVDASDALAVAICYIHSINMREAIEHAR